MPPGRTRLETPKTTLCQYCANFYEQRNPEARKKRIEPVIVNLEQLL
jgi:hypothetical protein